MHFWATLYKCVWDSERKENGESAQPRQQSKQKAPIERSLNSDILKSNNYFVALDLTNMWVFSAEGRPG